MRNPYITTIPAFIITTGSTWHSFACVVARYFLHLTSRKAYVFGACAVFYFVVFASCRQAVTLLAFKRSLHNLSNARRQEMKLTSTVQMATSTPRSSSTIGVAVPKIAAHYTVAADGSPLRTDITRQRLLEGSG